MHEKFADFFVDPASGEELVLEIDKRSGPSIITGKFRSKSNEYPIVRGIPRFAGYEGDNYADSFAFQWNKWARVQFEKENIGRPLEGHTTRMWEAITGNMDSLKGKTLLDIGCGPGRFTDVARTKGAIVIGIDYSAAVEAAAENMSGDPNVCICQADALCLPLRSDSVDGAFTIGVLHHTPDPEEGVKEASRVIKSGGRFALSVYTEGSYYDAPMVQRWRRLFKATWPLLRHYPPLAYSYLTVFGLKPLRHIPVIGAWVRYYFPCCDLADSRWSILDTFDSVTPSYQSAHNAYEVYQWLSDAGFRTPQPTAWGSTAWHAKKP